MEGSCQILRPRTKTRSEWDRGKAEAKDGFPTGVEYFLVELDEATCPGHSVPGVTNISIISRKYPHLLQSNLH